MPKTNYLTRCHDSDPDVIRQREIDHALQVIANKIKKHKAYQKWYQSKYAVTTDARREKQKLYQREYRLHAKEAKP